MNISDHIELVIPTYNRAEYLQRTLLSLASSPFNSCKITVLDNASTDKTKLVSKSMAHWLKGLVYVRNARNIGGEFNYCKAVEISRAPYVWILGDDDSYYWHEYEDLLGAISSGKHDLILPGVSFTSLPHGQFRFQDLLGKERLIYELSFVPSCIFRRTLYTDAILEKAKAWSDMGNTLPMMPLLDEMARVNASVWVSRIQHIARGRRHGYSPLKVLADWRAISLSCDHIGEAMRWEMFGGLRGVKNFAIASLISLVNYRSKYDGKR